MNNIKITFFWLVNCLLVSNLSSQNLRFKVESENSGESLPYALVAPNIGNPFYANDEGYFTLAVGEKNDSCRISYVGYDTKSIALNDFTSNFIHTIKLAPSADLPTVTVRTPPDIFNRSLSVVSPKIEDLERVPTLIGESDLIKGLQLFPGISNTNEATAGLSIRGGNTSQTHLVIDGIAVYNTNHIGGFISTLPTFGVKGINVYKGGVPARYGGRLSGVVDVTLREGRQDSSRYETVIGTGLLRAGAEGPLNKHWSYVITGRIAYPTLVAQALRGGSSVREKSGDAEVFNLRDAIAKLTYRSNRLKISTSLFASGDSGFSQNDFEQQRFNFDEFSWSNIGIAQQLRYFVGNTLTLNLRARYGRYGYTARSLAQRTFGEETLSSTSRLSAQLSDPGIDFSVIYQLGRNSTITFGNQTTSHNFSNIQQRTNPDEVVTDTLNLSQSSLQTSTYLQANFRLLNQKLQIEAGLRNSRLVDPKYTYWEPRLRVGARFSKLLSVNAALDYNTQFVHRIATDDVQFPNELWLIAGRQFQPARSRQYSVGLSSSLGLPDFDVTLEVFDKTLDNLTEASPLIPAHALVTDFLQTMITNGQGKVRGVELFIRKETERLMVTVAYTLSRSERQFPTINRGEWFPYTFDKTHELNTVIGYALRKDWYFTGTFTYQTGRAVTVPILTSPAFDIFGDINNARFPPFHRLNVAFEKTWSGNRRPSHKHTLTLSVYNTYNRSNPYAVSVVPISIQVPNPDTGVLERQSRVEFSVRSLLPIIPGVAYKRNF